MKFHSRIEISLCLRRKAIRKPGVNRLNQVLLEYRIAVMALHDKTIYLSFTPASRTINTHFSEHGPGKLLVNLSLLLSIGTVDKY